MPEVMLVQDREASFEGVKIIPAKKNKKFIQKSQIWYLKEIGDETLKLQIEFRNALFSAEIMENQAKRFLTLMEKVLQNPTNLPLESFDLLTKNEEDQFLDFRQSLSNPVPVISPIELIFQQLQKNPDKISVKAFNQQLTSKEFMKKIIEFAEKLEFVYEAKFKKELPLSDQPVALLLDRSIDLIILVLACWYLNLAPLMITPDWPIDRILTSLKGFQNLLLITDNGKIENKGDSFGDLISVIFIKTFYALKPNHYKSHHRLSMATSNPTDLAYLTFTSGSTGIPKAVQSLQLGLINLWQNYSHHFSITSSSTVYQVVNPAFDIFFADLISALGNGGTLFLASQKIPKMNELKECTHAYIMPAYLSQLDLDNPKILKILKNLKAILFGGEPINPNCLQKALEAGLNLFQQFGVTEHSIYSNFISPSNIDDRLVVGQNFGNFHGYLIDSDGCRLPPINLGIQGWFRSAGIAVSRGYIGANAQKQNYANFGEEPWFDGWRYFDSGDSMKYMPLKDDEKENPWNCKFIFCGRNDTQIKIRGNRVELRDVEEPFRQHSNVKEVVCLFDGSKLLTFISFKNSSLTNEKDLRELAQEKLPIYLITDTFVILEKFPLNSNGKIDRQKLLSMITVTDTHENVAKNDIKEKYSKDLTKIFCEIFAKHLKLPSILSEDDLFQKGADSLKLLMALQEIEDTVGIKLDISTIFRQRSISKTLEFNQNDITKNVQMKKQPLNNLDDKNYETKIHQLSFSQEHLWFLEKLKQDSTNSSTSDAYILKFKIISSESLIEKKWNDMIKYLLVKHPILRTQIIENNGIPSQKILEISDKLVQQLQTTDIGYSIDILKEPPVKYKLSQDLKIAEIGCHHIAIDGYSLNILINDMETFLNLSSPLAPIIPDYKYFDFIIHQKTQNFSTDLQFFQQILAKIKDFSSPTDFPRSNYSSFKAGHYRTSFETRGIDDFLSRFQISETHFVLAIFALQQFGNKFQSNTDNNISIGLPFANRTSTFSSTIGYFVNAHAIPILLPSSTESFHDFCIQIRDTVLEILSHSFVPFEIVVRQLKPKREKNKSPIFQQMIIFEDLRNPRSFNNFKVEEMDSKEAKLDQTWRIKRIQNDKLEIHVEFIEALFNEETIAKTVENFKAFTAKVLEGKIEKIGDFFDDPKTAPEEIIENLWKEILELDKIEKDANFFEEGGHSLLAARLTSMTNNKFGIKASINLLFEYQTLEEYIEAIKMLLINDNDKKQDILIEKILRENQFTQKFPANPLQIPLLELIRKATEAANVSLLEAYINQIHIQCPNGIKIDKIKNLLEQLMERHTVLRTKFGYKKIDGSTIFEYHQEINDLEYCRKFLFPSSKLTTMNIFNDSVFRAFFNEGILTLEISHLISDGHSMNILVKDLSTLFSNKPLPFLSANYQHFNQIFYENAHQLKKEQKEFWSKMFQHENNYSQIETDFIEKDFDYSSGTISKTFLNANSNLAESVKSYHCNPLTLILYSFAFRFREKLQNFNAPLRIAFCKDMRPSEDYYNCIGFFINTLIIPIEISDTIFDIDQKIKNAQKYSWITVDEIRKLMTKNDSEHIFDVMVVLDNSPTTEMSNNKLDGFQIIETNQISTKFNLTIFIQTNGKNLNVKVEYRKSLWSDETIETLLMAWEADGFEEKVPKISKALPHSNESNLITVDFDKRDITVILLEVFEKYSGNIAFKTKNTEITYNDLKKQIFQISDQIKEEYFKATGCLFGPDTIIPVISKNSIEQWLLCIGIIFAGGAYLPIDAKTPEERILNILKQLEPTLIISDVIIDGYKSIKLNKLKKSTTTNINKSFKSTVANAYNLAYIIFTSGTTGIPKGVCINRLGLSNLISDAQNFFSINSTSIIYQFTNFCFDNSILEIFAALGSGATCFIPGEYFTADKFCKNITDYGITHAMLFPGLVETFDDNELEELKKLKYWICGAEKLSKNLFKKAKSFGINIIQNYGPTETTAYCLRKRLSATDDPQNLGKPIRNAIAIVRRPDGWEAMVGSKFELFIASIGLMRGYLGRKWIEQPFVTFGDGLR
uniref:Carrier domain-containing protein n=1 Tax=Panagrolaimus sp. ES5 TaxID=591445 RepID=A0AC34F390_9BILA